jgi:D-apionolactonase
MTDRGIKLFGTDEPVPERRLLTAGPVTATLENGQLRWIKIGAAEAIRSISFTVRDRNWSTPVPEITNLKIDESGRGFKVEVDALCRTIDGDLAWHAEYTGARDGTIRCVGTAKTDKDFLTCRTGFVILHPLSGVVGKSMKIEHVDGSTEQSIMPEQILSEQPFLLVRAMTHEPMPGVTAEIRMEGDSWETEDHRNWTDASFKTYCRPLLLPYPYTIPAGGEVKHTATLTFTGQLPAGPAKSDGAVTVKLGGDAGRMPRIGLSVLPEDAVRALSIADLVKQAAPQHLNCRIDLRARDWEQTIPLYRDLAAKTGAETVLEVIIPGTGAPNAELQPLAAALGKEGLKPAAIVVTPAADLKSYPPGTPYPDNVPSWTDIAAAARHHFPGTRIGGGMLSNFTELNRKQPPKGVFDFVTHATSGLVHAADDRSVMETLDSIGHIIRATKTIIGTSAYHIGPSHIGNSFNPYGANYTENPKNRRVTMARVEPRHRGLFGAAWHLGYISQVAHGGVEAVTMASPVGEFGIAYAKLPHAQPGFDNVAGAKIYPVFHVIRGLSAAAGLPHVEAKSGDTERLRCVAWRKGKALHLWLANLHDQALDVTLDGFPANGTLGTLDEQSFDAATKDAAFGDRSAAFSGPSVKLAPLATAWLVFGA